jgi:hypothetical protein
VRVDGTCPNCGRIVDPGHAHAPAPVPAVPAEDAEEDDLPPIPWHLKLLASAVAIYLGYRALQGIEWLIGRF